MAPTKFGNGGPSLTTTCTGLFCGQDVPATGYVAITTPDAMVAEACGVAVAGISPAALRAWSACVTGCPVTCGTVFMIGPSEAMTVTLPPCRMLAPAAGS